MRTLLLFALLSGSIALSAADDGRGPLLRTRIDGHFLTITMANLKQEKAYLRFAPLDAPKATLFRRNIKNHNGHQSSLDLNLLDYGRYILSVKHEGIVYQQVIRVEEAGIFTSKWKEEPVAK